MQVWLRGAVSRGGRTNSKGCTAGARRTGPQVWPFLGDPQACSPAPPPPSPGPPVTFLVLVDAQGDGDVVEGLFVEGSDQLGLRARHRQRGRGRGRRGRGAPLGGHEGAREALAEPREEEPQVEGDQTQQREADEQRVGEVVQVPLMRRLRRRGRPGGGPGGGRAGGRRPGRHRAAGAAGAFLLPSSTRRIHPQLPLPPPP